MLELDRVTKVYKTGTFVQKALSSVSLKFREKEFTAILGPSGSGKTTLLNIIGGLDQYTSGDLIIDGISTKKYKDADWDTYRNHRIGFVFQSYNLIPHQTILNNVRLSLTLSGVSKREALRRSKTALTKVGLQDHFHKRPAELSGGQMQRVAIARALVNDPDILLADEPTGALDSDTSVQIMDLLKEISRDKLVIMVTHNPDLAKKYSTRIIKLKDGKIVSDSNPAKSGGSEKRGLAKKSEPAHSSMSFWTALFLSFSNLLTKKGRTILVSLAGSIGIIGIALILAVSTGFQRYIDKIQEDTMSSYPLTLREESFSLGAMFDYTANIYSDLSDEELSVKLKDFDLMEYPLLAKTFSTVSTNDLKSFQEYYAAHEPELKHTVSRVIKGYSVDPTIYAKDATGKIAKLNPSKLFSSMMGNSIVTTAYSSEASVFTQLDTPKEDLDENFDVLAGRWPESFNELVIILPYHNNLPDIMAYSLGLKDTSELTSLVQKLMAGESVAVPKASEFNYYNYEDLLALDIRLIIPANLYSYNEKYDVYEDRSEDQDFVKNVFAEKSIPLKIVGIATGKEGSLSASMNTGVSYTPALIEYIINQSKDTEPVKRQLANEEKDVFSGNRFDEKASFDYNFEDLVSVDSAALEDAFNIKIDQSTVAQETSAQMTEIMDSVSADITPARSALVNLLNKYSDNLFVSIEETQVPYNPSLNPGSLNPTASLDPANSENPTSPENPIIPAEITARVLRKSEIAPLVDEYLDTYEVGTDFAALEEEYKLPAEVYRQAFSGILKSFFETYVTTYASLDPSLTEDPEDPVAALTDNSYNLAKQAFFQSEPIIAAEEQIAIQMTEIRAKLAVMEKVMSLTASVANVFAESFDINPNKISSAFRLNFTEDELMRVMTSMLGSSDKSAKTNLLTLGYQDLASPSQLAFYFSSFDAKNDFLKFLNNYNENVEEAQQIKYTDITGLLMDSVKTIINGISYVLIAFVSISLVVSSIMIGIITYISVYERTKEIGILRAMGASKHNISNIFNAETFIIGLLAGLFGIVFSFSIIPVINAILYHLTNNPNIAAYLPVNNALELVALSIILTIIGGLIPARSASKKDPVIALRTE